MSRRKTGRTAAARKHIDISGKFNRQVQVSRTFRGSEIQEIRITLACKVFERVTAQIKSLNPVIRRTMREPGSLLRPRCRPQPVISSSPAASLVRNKSAPESVARRSSHRLDSEADAALPAYYWHC